MSKRKEKPMHWLEEQLSPHVDEMPGLDDRYKSLIKNTIIPQAIYFDNIATRNKGKDYGWSLTIILAGLATASLGPTGATIDGYRWLGLVTGGAGIAISLATKLRDEFKYAATYEQSRLASERIQSELRSFLFSSGDYSGVPIEQAVKKMHQRVEDINRGSVSQKFRDPEDDISVDAIEPSPSTYRRISTSDRLRTPTEPSPTPEFSYRPPGEPVLSGEENAL